MMKSFQFVVSIFFISMLFGTHASAEFVGRLVLTPTGCQQTGQCTLGAHFGYIDKRNIGWEADAGDVTDGASIPRWAQFFAGVPFDEKYLPAAVLHDHYSKSVRPVMGWFETQRMFHEVLIASGTSRSKAALLYSGVLLGSGKWINSIQGKPCPTLSNCVNAVQPGEPRLLKELPSFASNKYKQDFESLMKTIIDDEVFDIYEIENLARELRPDDIYLNNPSGTVNAVVGAGGVEILSSEF